MVKWEDDINRFFTSKASTLKKSVPERVTEEAAADVKAQKKRKSRSSPSTSKGFGNQRKSPRNSNLGNITMG